MIALSSLKPWTDPTEEHARNQFTAWQSWKVFTEVFYFNDKESGFRGLDTGIIIPTEDFPLLKWIAIFASQQADWCAILNADIVIGEKFPAVEEKLKKRFTAATSWRYQFDPEKGIASAEAKPSDMGLDFFCATPDVWRRVAEECPEDLRIGCQQWDTWLLSFFATFECESYADITPARVVFHPRHENRQYGPAPKTPKLWSWPVMSPAKIFA